MSHSGLKCHTRHTFWQAGQNTAMMAAGLALFTANASAINTEAMSLLQRPSCQHTGAHEPHFTSRRCVLSALIAAGLPVIRPQHASAAVVPYGVQPPAEPTIFQKKLMACAASQQMVEAARAVAEFEICSTIDSPQSCALDNRSSLLKRQVSVMNNAASVLRESLPGTAAQAIRKGPPPPNSLEVLLRLASTPEGVPDQVWANKVFNQQKLVDQALLNMQVQANALMNDTSGVVDWQRLVDFANSIKTSRELYNQWVALTA